MINQQDEQKFKQIKNLNTKLQLYYLKVSSNVTIAMRCFENFEVGQMPPPLDARLIHVVVSGTKCLDGPHIPFLGLIKRYYQCVMSMLTSSDGPQT